MVGRDLLPCYTFREVSVRTVWQHLMTEKSLSMTTESSLRLMKGRRSGNMHVLPVVFEYIDETVLYMQYIGFGLTVRLLCATCTSTVRIHRHWHLHSRFSFLIPKYFRISNHELVGLGSTDCAGLSFVSHTTVSRCAQIVSTSPPPKRSTGGLTSDAVPGSTKTA